MLHFIYLLQSIFFIVPINSTLLDVMLALNISIALIVLFNTLFVKEVLDMSFFPTLLLFTTIFRISLNVSSTRLILTTGNPGNVVQTFGQLRRWWRSDRRCDRIYHFDYHPVCCYQ